MPVSLMSLALVMLGVMGELFRKLIGAVYINSSTNRVKISHLNFWGNRKDIIVNMSDIVPISDTDDKFSDVYVKVKFYSQQKPLFLTVKYGHLLNKDSFHQIFGKDV